MTYKSLKKGNYDRFLDKNESLNSENKVSNFFIWIFAPKLDKNGMQFETFMSLNERKVAWLKTKCSVLIAYVIFQAVAHLSSSAAKPVEIKVKIHLTQNKNLKLKKLAKIRWETGGVQFGTKSAIAWQLCPLQLLLIWRRNRRI